MYLYQLTGENSSSLELLLAFSLSLHQPHGLTIKSDTEIKDQETAECKS